MAGGLGIVAIDFMGQGSHRQLGLGLGIIDICVKLQWEGFSVPVQAKMKRLQKFPP